MSAKFKTCKYNSNRHAWKIAYPWCTWQIPQPIPPHLYLMKSCEPSEMANICAKCKCYEKAED